MNKWSMEKMSQVNTNRMGRLLAAGMKSDIGEVVKLLSKINALHILDYDGSEEDFSLGKPLEGAEEVGRELNKMRSALSMIKVNQPEKRRDYTGIKNRLIDDLPGKVDNLIELTESLTEYYEKKESLQEKESILEMLAPLEIDIGLLDGYQNLTSFIGLVGEIDLEKLGEDIIAYHGKDGKNRVIAVFCKNSDSGMIQKILVESGFNAIVIPDGVGNPRELIEELSSQISNIDSKIDIIEKDITAWSDENGELLLCGIELLEREHEILTAPVRIAVSNHAFLIDGWIESNRAEEVQRALKSVCNYTEVIPFELKAGGGGHGHSDNHHHQELPPISYSEREMSKPMELLTDAVGRPGYGRIDPTLFMFITYPIFFGMMLGDMAYGLITMLLGGYLISKSGTNEMLKLGGKFLTYIGFGTLVFGYIYAEFAGWEILPHYGNNPAEALAFLYPFELDHGHAWTASLPFGLELAFPFHRVTPTSDYGNLEHLIILTIYLGLVHVMMGLMIGFRDILLFGNGHGGIGLVCAFFEKGVWMMMLIGGFMFSYGFLGPPDGEGLMIPGAVLAAVSVILLMWTLYKYHGVPFPINVGLAPIEAVGMIPTVISYVRLFAVGIVGVKIAETGNHMLFEPMAEMISDGQTLFLVPVFLIGWILVQVFAWGLGVFSPNIHAARLHFVEWMRQYYDASGEPFMPFGVKPQFVEAEK